MKFVGFKKLDQLKLKLLFDWRSHFSVTNNLRFLIASVKHAIGAYMLYMNICMFFPVM